jgi:hypothetical protein
MSTELYTTIRQSSTLSRSCNLKLHWPQLCKTSSHYLYILHKQQLSCPAGSGSRPNIFSQFGLTKQITFVHTQRLVTLCDLKS